jgi:hypothetical protein
MVIVELEGGVGALMKRLASNSMKKDSTRVLKQAL